MPSRDYEAIVIGTGQAGKPRAKAFAQAGHRTAVLESAEKVGGTCVVAGCNPTKTMIASARVAHLVRRAADYGVVTGPVSVDLSRVRERKRAIVDSFSGGSRRGLERQNNLDLIFGEASFEGPKEIRVVARDGSVSVLTAPRIFINTGARPSLPDVPGLSDVPFLTSTTILELDRVPEHLVILGGGYIGLEFAQMFRRFGARVSLVQRRSQLLPNEDEDVATQMAEILHEDGVEVLLSANPERINPEADGANVHVETPENARDLHASALLVATGREPASDRLNLEAAGVSVDSRGFITIDERLETNVPGIYALGDVNGSPAFTHISYDDYRIVEMNLLEGGSASTTDRLVPYTVFTDPELGRVGLTEKEARKRGLDVRVAKLPMSHVARALESDETRGFMKAIVDASSPQRPS